MVRVSRSKFYLIAGFATACYLAFWLHHQHVYAISHFTDRQQAAPSAITKALLESRQDDASGLVTKYAVLSACQITSEPHKYMFTGEGKQHRRTPYPGRVSRA
jgi:hypothetical protein